VTDFTIKANYKEIADKLGVVEKEVAKKLNGAVEALSISTHAFIIKYAQDHLKGYPLEAFLGEDGSNIRWIQVSKNMWVVEIDESAKWVEEGRSPTSMATDDWLLKPGKGLKTARDGSKFKIIPFSHDKGALTTPSGMREAIDASLKANGVSMRKIEKGPDGMPKIGIVNRLKDIPQLNDPASDNIYQYRSKGRTADEAEALGLPNYEGAHYLSGGVVVQRPSKKGKVKKEVVTFRVVSSKHENEQRWLYPEVKPLHSIPAAYDYATKEWDKIVKSLEDYFRGA
jgi:hypothetical protein